MMKNILFKVFTLFLFVVFFIVIPKSVSADNACGFQNTCPNGATGGYYDFACFSSDLPFTYQTSTCIETRGVQHIATCGLWGSNSQYCTLGGSSGVPPAGCQSYSPTYVAGFPGHWECAPSSTQRFPGCCPGCPANVTCPTSCGYGGGDVPNGSCGSHYCNPTASCTSCTVSLSPTTIGVGGTAVLTATTTATGGTIAIVGFVSGTPANVTVSPASDNTAGDGYTTTASALSQGTSTITATATMSGGQTCNGNAVVTVPACTVALTPATQSINTRETWPFTATLTNITPDSVDFSSNNGNITLDPASDTTFPYITTATGVSAGSSIITASAIFGTPGTVRCSDTSDVTIIQNDPWWQVKDGDVTTKGSLNSSVTPGNLFGTTGFGGYPGIPAFGGSTNLTGANVSAKGWLANSSYNAIKSYNSTYFLNSVPFDVSVNDGTLNEMGSTADFNNLPNPIHGYYWYEYDPALNGDVTPLTINASALDAKKIILLVKGDVLIKGNINLTKGSGFFLLVTSGNIIVDPSVGGAGPNLEGVYVADGLFQSGLAATQLWVRGTIAAYGGVSLQRDLGGSNSTTPGELFEFAPDLELLFPGQIGARTVSWQEVAP